jgi:hypothetical protein
MKYTEVLIKPTHSDIGLYQAKTCHGQYQSVVAFAKAVESAYGLPVYRVGSDLANKLQIKDIRGAVFDELDVILGSTDGKYYGLKLTT